MKAASPSGAPLPKHHVDVVEAKGRERPGWNKCEIEQNLKFNTTALESHCFANWNVRVWDAFVVAAAIQFCDHTKARTATCWGRDIALNVPVHEPKHWCSPDVSDPLHAALRLLTGDRWKINFAARKSQVPRPRIPRFEFPDESRVIAPFSDGLDSLAASQLAERKYGNRVLRVRLGRSSANGHPSIGRWKPVALVPYSVSYGNRGSVESSSLSRGFKFALLAGIAAYLCKAKRIIMPESGQGAIGPTLIPVGQTYEDYRNHPSFTNRMEEFLRALFGHTVHYVFPHLWSTKAETLKTFVDECADGASWKHTRSCWRGQRHVSVLGKMRQCGICAACMLRRMSVHAIGLAERRDAYVWENLSATHFEAGAAPGAKRISPKGASYEYAIAGTLHMDHLANLLRSPDNRNRLDLQVFHLSQALEVRENDIRHQLERLLRKHEEEWKTFLDSLGPKSFVVNWAMGVQ